MINNLKIHNLDWDSQRLGIKCGIIDLPSNLDYENNNNLSRTILELVQSEKEISFITIKLNAIFSNVVNALIKVGATLIDSELTYQYNPEQKPGNERDLHDYRFEFCKKTDSNPFIALSKQMVMSRFYLDERISTAKAEALWTESIKNHCEGYADELLVAFFNDEPCGLVTIRLKKKQKMFLHIIGVVERFQRRGIAPAMLKKITERYWRDYSICIETQSINTSAQKAYMKSGFQFDTLKYILHYWRMQ